MNDVPNCRFPISNCQFEVTAVAFIVVWQAAMDAIGNWKSAIEWYDLTVKTKVIIYSRPGCHLCEEAKTAMRAASCEGEYTLDEVNIENDPELLERYKDDIPVITFNGVEAFRHRVTPEEFRRRIMGS